MAKGNFSQTPFSHILVYLLEKKLNGTLEIRTNDSEITVYFRKGTPAKVRSTIPCRNLGNVLQQLKLITDDQLNACDEEIAENGGLQSDVLLRLGVIDTPDLVKGLKQQMLLQLTDGFALTDASFAFYKKVNSLIGYGPNDLFPIDTYTVIMSGLRKHAKHYNFAAACNIYKGKWVSIEDADTIRRFKPDRAEKELLKEIIETPRSYDALLLAGRHDPLVIQYTFYALMITKSITIHENEPIDSAVLPADDRVSMLDSIQPSSSMTPDDPIIALRKRQIEEKAASIASQNYYEMLGLPFSAPPYDVRKAFFRLAKDFHPDKVPSQLAVVAKESLLYVFSNLTEAHSVLLDAESREAYNATIYEGQKRTSHPPPANGKSGSEDIQTAEVAFQKALMFLKRNDYKKAEELAEKAKELNPEECEYVALWIYFEARKRAEQESVDDLIEKLRQMLKDNPESERAHLYLAQLFKRQGKPDEAQKRYQTVLQLNKHNIEAARELRLIGIRKKKDSGPRPSLIGRLFNSGTK